MDAATTKTFDFTGTAGGYFVLSLVTIISVYIPFFGWAFALNYTANWFVGNVTVGGKKLKYKAGYWEAFKFIFLNSLLVMITFGIYSFWFVPKTYRFVTAHSDFEDATPAAPAPVASPSATSPSVS